MSFEKKETVYSFLSFTRPRFCVTTTIVKAKGANTSLTKDAKTLQTLRNLYALCVKKLALNHVMKLLKSKSNTCSILYSIKR